MKKLALLSLLALPPCVLVAGPWLPASPPASSADVYVSLRCVDGAWTPVGGIPVSVENATDGPFVGVTDERGQTAFHPLTAGSLLTVTRGEAPTRDGLVLGSISTLSTYVPFGDGGDYACHVHTLGATVAETVLLDSTPAEDLRFAPERTLALWEIVVPAGSGVRASMDVATLVNAQEVASFLAYYDQDGAVAGGERGLVLHVGNRGGVDLGDEGLVLSMRDFDSWHYGDHAFSLAFFAADGESTANGIEVSAMDVDDSVDWRTDYWVRGALPQGHLVLTWSDALASGSEPESTVSPVLAERDFPLTSGEPLVLGQAGSDECQDCEPPLCTATPGWECSPQAGLGDLFLAKWLGADCPGDGQATGDISCQQWCYSLSPVFCKRQAAEISVNIESSGSVAVSVSVGGAEVGATAEWSSSFVYPLQLDAGAHGCGECGQVWGVALVCGQEFQNDEHTTHTEWLFNGPVQVPNFDCGRSDPFTGTCTKEKIQDQDCDRTPL